MERLVADRGRLLPEDVEWVVEWQLVTCFPWLPLAADSCIMAAPHPEAPEGKIWPVTVRVAQTAFELRIPVRDLARVVYWCHDATDFAELIHPPRALARSLMGLRNALRFGVSRSNPLDRMGYSRETGSDEASERR